MKIRHGILVDGTYIKQGKAVVKYWDKGGYGIPQDILLQDEVKRVKLFTKYDGRLMADKETFNTHGLLHKFKDEWQLVLKTEHWTQEES